MLGWLMIGASVVIMSRVADSEDRSPIIWGAITFALCFGSTFIIPFPFVNIFPLWPSSFAHGVHPLRLVRDSTCCSMVTQKRCNG